MPLAFSTILGGVMTLIASPTTLLVSTIEIRPQATLIICLILLRWAVLFH